VSFGNRAQKESSSDPNIHNTAKKLARCKRSKKKTGIINSRSTPRTNLKKVLGDRQTRQPPQKARGSEQERKKSPGQGVSPLIGEARLAGYLEGRTIT